MRLLVTVLSGKNDRSADKLLIDAMLGVWIDLDIEPCFFAFIKSFGIHLER